MALYMCLYCPCESEYRYGGNMLDRWCRDCGRQSIFRFVRLMLRGK
jgi:hypothetical protein